MNALGYGQSDLQLNLVFNPQGPDLPAPQAALEADYKKLLAEQYGIVFNQLYTICNMPIKRFGSLLISKGQFDNYMQLLRGAYQDDNLETVMCRNLISVDWQGYVYDCDFNQMLGLPLSLTPNVQTTVRQSASLSQTVMLENNTFLDNDISARRHISELIDKDLTGNPIIVAEHCYGCTAGQGSSCGGALS